MESISPTARTRVRRRANRAAYDSATLHAIVDEALLCHLGVVVDGMPRVLPTLHVRLGSQIYVHGAPRNGTFDALRTGAPVCLTISLVDGLVLARSAMHHSMNYRSVMVYGTAREVTDVVEKRRALEAMVEHVMPGRLAEVRPPDESEIHATAVFALPISEASAKVRQGPPVDAARDLALPAWAGVVPLRLTAGRPQEASDDEAGTAAPSAALRRYMALHGTPVGAESGMDVGAVEEGSRPTAD